MTYSVEITRADSSTRSYDLNTEQVTIGSAISATIHLANEPNLLAEQILLVPNAEQCWVATTTGTSLHTEEGRSVTAEYVPWGTSLTAGAMRLTLKNETDEQTSKVAPRDESGRKKNHAPLVPIFTLLGCAALWLVFQGNRHGPLRAPHLEVALFDDKVPTCEHENPLHRAQQLGETAQAKSERYAFAPQDGVQAVHLFAASSACFRKARQKAEATEMERLGKALQNQIESDLQLSRLRLSRSIERQDVTSALGELRVLSSLVQEQPNTPFAVNLRRLRAQLGQKHGL